MNTYLKYFLIGLGIILGVFIVVKLLTPKTISSQEVKEFETKIDDLRKNNLELIKKQIELDSLTAEYDERLQDIEFRLSNVGTSKIIIQKIYNDKINKSKEATPSEVDSFFKQRYKY
jgi:VIT1/CCC1 family predicted Fe2+/Mn2+ transporter